MVNFGKPVMRKGGISSMAEETKRVEAQLEKLRVESQRVKAYAESMGIGKNGVSPPPRVRRWPASTSITTITEATLLGPPIRSTRDLLTRRSSSIIDGSSQQQQVQSPNAILAAASNAIRSALGRGDGSSGAAVGSSLSAIAGLRAGGGGGGGASRLNAAAARGSAPPVLMEKSDVGDDEQNSGGSPLHWSLLPPLNDGSVNVASNFLSSGEDLDEAAERAAFQAAVAAWRKGGKPQIVGGTSAIAAAGGGDGQWVNPFGGGGGGGGGGGATTTAPSSSTKAPLLLEGTYDEDAEAAAFKESVRLWREGGKPAATSSSSSTAVSAVAAGSSPLQHNNTHHTSTNNNYNTTNNNTHLESRTACYQCLRLYYISSGICGENGKNQFCSNSCHTTYQSIFMARQGTLNSARNSAPPLPPPVSSSPREELTINLFDMFADVAAAAGAALVAEDSNSPATSTSSPLRGGSGVPTSLKPTLSPLSSPPPPPRSSQLPSFASSFDSITEEAEKAAKSFFL